MFHDFFGHVPVLTQPAFADFMQLYGKKAAGAVRARRRRHDHAALLVHGRIRPDAGSRAQPLKAFGAGLMSSFTELQFAVESADAHHVPFDLETVMRTGYEIDKFQRAYFVLPSFDALKDALQKADIGAIVKRWKDAPPLDPAAV